MKYSKVVLSGGLLAVVGGILSVPNTARADTSDTVAKLVNIFLGKAVVCEMTNNTSLSKAGDLAVFTNLCPSGMAVRLNVPSLIKTALDGAAAIARQEVRNAAFGGPIKRVQVFRVPVFAQPGGALGYPMFMAQANCQIAAQIAGQGLGWYAMAPATIAHPDQNAIIGSQIPIPDPINPARVIGYGVAVIPKDVGLLLMGNYGMDITCASNQ